MANKENIDQLFNLKASFPTDEEKKAFFSAAQNNDIKALGKIIDKWPEAPTKWDYYGDPVIVEHFGKMTATTIDYLVSRGADINQYDKDNFWSALSLAAHHGEPENIEKLLRCGADPNVPNKYGQVALTWAAEKGHFACADVLVLCGATPEDGLKASKDDDMQKVIRSAQERRENFLKSMEPASPSDSASAAVAMPAPTSETIPATSENVIRIMKRIELKKAGHDPGPEPEETAAPGKKSWLRRKLGF